MVEDWCANGDIATWDWRHGIIVRILQKCREIASGFPWARL